jgi:hypothetical protein
MCYFCVTDNENVVGVACGLCVSDMYHTVIECYDDVIQNGLGEESLRSSVVWTCDALYGEHTCQVTGIELPNSYCFGTRGNNVIRVNPTYAPGDQCVVGQWEPVCTVSSI